MEIEQMNNKRFLLRIFPKDTSQNMEHDFLLHFVTEEIKDISDQDIFLDEVFEEENYTEYVLTSNFESATKFAQTLREFFNYNIYLKIKS